MFPYEHSSSSSQNDLVNKEPIKVAKADEPKVDQPKISNVLKTNPERTQIKQIPPKKVTPNKKSITPVKSRHNFQRGTSAMPNWNGYVGGSTYARTE